MNSQDISILICFGYVQAKLRSFLFFIPDNWFSIINVTVINEHFLSILKKYHDYFSEESFRFYLYIFSIFSCSFAICAFSIYQYFQYQITAFHRNTITTGLRLNIEEYQAKYPHIFGNHINIFGLNFSQHLLETPFYIWCNDDDIESIIAPLLLDARRHHRKVMIFSRDNILYQKISQTSDILLNPIEADGASWNIFKDLQYHKNILSAELLKTASAIGKSREIHELIQYLSTLDINTEEFFQILCFAPFKQVKSELSAFTNVDDNQELFISIRNQLSDSYYGFKSSKSKELSIAEYCKSDQAVLWITGAESDYLKTVIPFIERIIAPNIMKIAICDNIITPTSNTIAINQTSFDGQTFDNCNKLLLSKTTANRRFLSNLFGDTTVKYPFFIGAKYKDFESQIISTADIDVCNIFKYNSADDILLY